MQTIVIGHKNPDMDSICSAVAYAHLKQTMGFSGVIAARAGATNERIDFVLEKFGIEAPVFISDLSPRVSDVMEHEVISILAGAPIYEAIHLIERHRLRGLPVIDELHRCLGLLSTFKISHYLFPQREEAAKMRETHASLAAIVTTFEGSVVTNSAGDELRNYLLVVAAMGVESFGRRMKNYEGRDVIVIDRAPRPYDRLPW